MVIDLDRFKPVNDIHGHAAGNAVICAVAVDSLTSSPSGICRALGGDEFAASCLRDGPGALVDWRNS